LSGPAAGRRAQVPWLPQPVPRQVEGAIGGEGSEPAWPLKVRARTMDPDIVPCST